LKKIIVVASMVITMITIACKKPAGEGGRACIRGTVHSRNYNSNFSTFLNQHPGADLDVYIIYGDDATYGDRIRSGPDGVFEFKYLRKGNYKIYVYSRDSLGTVGPPYSTLNPNTHAPDKAVFKSVEINDKKAMVDAGTLEIFD
jgi:hypothetical protein